MPVVLPTTKDSVCVRYPPIENQNPRLKIQIDTRKIGVPDFNYVGDTSRTEKNSSPEAFQSFWFRTLVEHGGIDFQDIKLRNGQTDFPSSMIRVIQVFL